MAAGPGHPAVWSQSQSQACSLESDSLGLLVSVPAAVEGLGVAGGCWTHRHVPSRLRSQISLALQSSGSAPGSARAAQALLGLPRLC